MFISFEGGEGTGKTTQIKNLAAELERKGRTVATTREPGGTEEAEKIRALLVQTDGGDWTPMAECLLLFAARQMHIETLIKPKLKQGHIVITDRFTDSTRAYQSYGHKMPIEIVERLNRLTIDNFKPDLTFILDMPVEVGVSRSNLRLEEVGSNEDRFENLDISFHERLRQGFLDIAKSNKDRCYVIDAAASIEQVEADILDIVERRIV